MHELAVQLRATRWTWLLLAAVAGLAAVWARARRWWYLFPPGADPPGLLAAMMIGYMANNVLPLRAGELIRVFVVSRRWGHGFWLAMATSIIERLLDGVTIVAVLCALLFFIPVPGYLVGGAVTLLTVEILGVAVLVALTARPAACRRLLERLTRRWPRLRTSAVPMLDTFLRGLDGIRALRRLPAIVAWTVIIWVLPAVATWAGLRAVNLDLSWLAAWTVLVFVGLSVSVPSAPGFVGVFHFAATKAVALFGVPAAAGLGFALVFHASQFVPVTLVGWLFLLRENMSLVEAARRRPVEHAVGGEETGAR